MDMEWIERLNCAVNYLEEHLTEEFNPAEAAKVAGCSAYHFQRMFAYMANVPLSEYIRRRRMSLAAVDLQSGSDKIVDLAFKYGYSSPTAFNRAFQSVHGVSPSTVKKGGAEVKSFPPISFKIIVKGVEVMNYTIKELQAFRIIGISRPLNQDIEKNFEVVPQMWQRAVEENRIPQLLSVMDGQPAGLLGVSACCGDDRWEYYIAVASSAPLEEGLKEYTVPACTWAVFAGSGTNVSIQELEKRIITEWLPTSGYEYADAPDIEVYYNADPQNAQYEVWVPVKRK